MFHIHTLQAYTITSLTNVYANSDKRLKENIKKPNLDFLSTIKKLKIYEFNLINDPEKRKMIGLIAQDLQKVIPEEYSKNLVYKAEDYRGTLSINEGKFPYILLGGIQELIKKDTKQDKEVIKLKEENKKLKEEIKSLKKDIKAIKKALNLE